MDLNLIKKLIKILEGSQVTDLEVEENGIRVKLAKKVRVTQSVAIPAASSVSPVSQQNIAPVVKSEEKKSAEETSHLHEIKSPIVGTFYRAPAPDADAYVQVGDVVSSGTVLCIVEAMKLMNEIESDVSGRIVKILVDNGKPVEYSQPLFLIEKS
ncbi:MAG: acetyl-CoA carboxylase biotin carboxyl carrier protein [Ignavibacteriota bacterium]|jgi:acetyl-CoA carboxylase biotin carboxyl carrier protein|nr:MAG: acetyl-CoA carboxylase biotin carboxyl carrier protein [Ignavibacterium sp.]MBL1154283.1 acetyl-CoA carboxylase biotin carboxyl carrier protein [Ignavibacteriota bacterium]MCO6448843.1 acetyl-CoA carboxylase biotin carboxyl carrier protein [Ignavibacterium album]MCZ2269530.1 acetyl-CoA carboxylase biotin carboxyl carrier protein [Ignavibacteriales bacterium]MDX9710957.1 acetyl-CoA carboxylase biotin carboxyl carrier protein [Ignavibacteriaceae bacterium]